VELRVVAPAVEIDDELTRTVRWTLEPGTTIGQHRHPLPYIVVPVMGGTLTFSDASTSRSVELVSGRPVTRAAGVEHNVSNLSDATVMFVEIEIKAR
jgi:quercetin dioxygenase-like cupin family protein